MLVATNMVVGSVALLGLSPLVFENGYVRSPGYVACAWILLGLGGIWAGCICFANQLRERDRLDWGRERKQLLTMQWSLWLAWIVFSSCRFLPGCNGWRIAAHALASAAAGLVASYRAVAFVEDEEMRTRVR